MSDKSVEELVNEANRETVKRIMESHPWLVDVRPAVEVVPGMKDYMLLHAGPPIEWERMCEPMKAAVLGAIVYEGWADTLEEARRLVEAGHVEFSVTHDHGCVAPMAGIISPLMPVYVVENKTYGNRAYSNLNEGVGRVKTLRFGANSPEVIQRLKWMRDVLGPALGEAVRLMGGIDLRELIAEALRRGDECHNRNKAATAAFFQRITIPLLETDLDRETIRSVLKFISGNVHFFLNISMASSKACMDAAHNIPYSSIVTAMSPNGVEFGIRVSGLGDEWFTAPAPRQAMGRIFEGYMEEDANPVFGDSYISEPAGIGAFAMAASPAISEFVGGSPQFGVEITLRMYEITVTEHKYYKIPYLGYRGTPLGIDIRKVVEKGIVPVVNTGIAHRKGGIGQIGAGIAYAPMECFRKALEAFKERYGL